MHHRGGTPGDRFVSNPEVVYVLPDKMGGVHSYVRSLLAYRRPDDFDYAAVLTRNRPDTDTASHEPLTGADRLVRFEYELPPENLRAVLARLARAAGRREGVLVANDWIELAMATVHDTGRAVVAVTHGDYDYYYRLAVTHEPVIDAYVTFSARIYDCLCALLPQRRDTIHLLKYGVAVPEEPHRSTTTGPLRLLYAGRIHRQKGVLDLPAIAAKLRERGCEAQWTIIGTGPDDDELRRQWPDIPVQFAGLQTVDAVLAGYREQDVLVMPSRNEGLPVVLLEGGAAGVVPVVSNIPSGIPEIVRHGETGFLPEVGDIDGFVDAILQINAERGLLARMSAAIRDVVSRQYDARVCTPAYQKVYADVMANRRPWRPRPLPYGSRLDRAWIPNRLVKWVRGGRNRQVVRS